jgi:hypothetical protein
MIKLKFIARRRQPAAWNAFAFCALLLRQGFAPPQGRLSCNRAKRVACICNGCAWLQWHLTWHLGDITAAPQ